MEVDLNLVFPNFKAKFFLRVQIFSADPQISTEIIYSAETMFYFRGSKSCLKFL